MRNGVLATPYENDLRRVAVVTISPNTPPQTIGANIFGSSVERFVQFTRSETKDAADDGAVILDGEHAT